MHIADFSVGMLGANGVVAAGIPIAAGAAHAIKLRGGREIVACFFGDGAVNRGPFLEGLNWAQIYRLPVLFVCEDNRYSATTATGAMTGGEGAAARAQCGRAARRGWSTATTSKRSTPLRRRSCEEVRAGRGPRFLQAVDLPREGARLGRCRRRTAIPTRSSRALEEDPLRERRGETRRARRRRGRHRSGIRGEAEREIAAAVAAAHAAPWPQAGQRVRRHPGHRRRALVLTAWRASPTPRPPAPRSPKRCAPIRA